MLSQQTVNFPLEASFKQIMDLPVTLSTRNKTSDVLYECESTD